MKKGMKRQYMSFTMLKRQKHSSFKTIIKKEMKEQGSCTPVRTIESCLQESHIKSTKDLNYVKLDSELQAPLLCFFTHAHFHLSHTSAG